MANINDVTLATLKTTAISADSVILSGKTIDKYIEEKSTGTKVSVEPITTEGTLIAKISCNSDVKEIYAPASQGGAEREYTAWEVLCNKNPILSGTTTSSDVDSIQSYDSEKIYMNGELVKYRTDDTKSWTIYIFKGGTEKSRFTPGTNENYWKTYYSSVMTYNYTVEPGHVEAFTLRTYHSQSGLDVVVDWGDGTITEVKEIADSNSVLPSFANYTALMEYMDALEDTNTIASWYKPAERETPDVEHNIELAHRYDVGDQILKTYTIKVYGKNYFCLRHEKSSGSKIITNNTRFGTNLMCRCFDVDLPIASNIINIGGFCEYAMRLLKAGLQKYARLGNIITNYSGLFKYCKNLQYVGEGFSTVFDCCSTQAQLGPLFSNCPSLTKCTVRLPATMCTNGSISDSFNFNGDGVIPTNLESDVLSLLPVNGFAVRIVNVGNAFQNLPKIKCTNYTTLADLLWNDWTKVFKTTENCFAGCTSLDLTKIPTAWGGTNTEIVINPNTKTVYPPVAP